MKLTIPLLFVFFLFSCGNGESLKTETIIRKDYIPLDSTKGISSTPPSIGDCDFSICFNVMDYLNSIPQNLITSGRSNMPLGYFKNSRNIPDSAEYGTYQLGYKPKTGLAESVFMLHVAETADHWFQNDTSQVLLGITLQNPYDLSDFGISFEISNSITHIEKELEFAYMTEGVKIYTCDNYSIAFRHSKDGVITEVYIWRPDSTQREEAFQEVAEASRW